MIRIKFISQHGSIRSQMAEGFARSLVDPERFKLTNAGFEPGQVHPLAVQVMAEVGIDISGQSHRLSADANILAIDLVIILGHLDPAKDSVLPGMPVFVRWDIPDPVAENRCELLAGQDANPLDIFRRTRDLIRRHIEDLFSGGYLPSLVAHKRNTETILDHFSDGIIVHDAHRHITWFNRSAEQITGYHREKVIGRDCHDVFSDGFCGGKCSFCSDSLPIFEKLHYPLKVNTKDGQIRRVEMTVVPMKNDQGEYEGVLASFHDVTEVTQLRRRLRDIHSFHGIIGADAKMQVIYELISDLSVSDCPVLIQGESGTGKELIAGAIHNESRRAGRPFVTVNCGALPEGILESELFGHVRGAFTGAVRDRKGRFELADGGTLFLDEVAELSSNMQVKLLRVLQEGTFQRVGGEKTVHVDVRVLSATNYDLRERVRQGQFREDLFYRLCVVPIHLPPLRERRNDIPLLLNHFLDRFGKELGLDIQAVAPNALHLMLDYTWPGNIRELQNALQYAFVKCKTNTIQIENLPPEIITFAGDRPAAAYARRRGKLQAEQVRQALASARGNKVKAAQLLGVGRATLYR
ncbi:MAG: sigma 54-interacting transcriptional regulator, partial [Sedimentisphaerales bacterium]|nr:sigma 54-interacting transcriptional regulator [Sedimentisphaerales bacterium]